MLLGWLVGTDTLNTVGINYLGSPTLPIYLSVGGYNIDASSATFKDSSGNEVTSNYNTPTYIPGTLTITPAPLSIIPRAQSTTYSSSVFNISQTSFDTSGALGGTTVATQIGVGGNTSIPSYTNADTYTLSSSNVVVRRNNTSENITSNFNINTTFTNTLTVNKANITVIPKPQSLAYYGNATPSLTQNLADASGLVGTDTINTVVINYLGSPTLPSYLDASGYNIDAFGATFKDASGNNVTSNYSPSYIIPGTLIISPASLTINPKPQSITYSSSIFNIDQTLFDASGVPSGTTVSSVVIDVSDNTSIPAYTNAGIYTLSTGTVVVRSTDTSGVISNSNFNITTNKSTLTVNKASVTVIAKPQSFIYYGSPAPTLTQDLADASGLVGTNTLNSTTITYDDSQTTYLSRCW